MQYIFSFFTSQLYNYIISILLNISNINIKINIEFIEQNFFKNKKKRGWDYL